jgi:hypothetical protein
MWESLVLEDVLKGPICPVSAGGGTGVDWEQRILHVEGNCAFQIIHPRVHTAVNLKIYSPLPLLPSTPSTPENICLFFFSSVLRFELRVSTLSHSTSPFFCDGFF